MKGRIRRLPVRLLLSAAVLTAVVAAATAWLVWRLISPGAPSGTVMAAVLGWGLGVIPVHVTLSAERGERHREGRRAVRRPAQTYVRGRPDRRTDGREGRIRGTGLWARDGGRDG